jgi:hypothetical protein
MNPENTKPAAARSVKGQRVPNPKGESIRAATQRDTHTLINEVMKIECRNVSFNQAFPVAFSIANWFEAGMPPVLSFKFEKTMPDLSLFQPSTFPTT